MAWYDAQIENILLTADEIAAGVRDVAARINADYRDREVILVGVLTGAAVFLSDLMRKLQFPLRVEFVQLRSYGDGTLSDGSVALVKDVCCDVSGRDVIIVEDIVDTGHSLHALVGLLQSRGAASVRTVCLLDKPSRRQVDMSADYCAFQIPDCFVVGYGMDCAQQFRNLPFVGTLRDIESCRACDHSTGTNPAL